MKNINTAEAVVMAPRWLQKVTRWHPNHTGQYEGHGNLLNRVRRATRLCDAPALPSCRHRVAIVRHQYYTQRQHKDVNLVNRAHKNHTKV